MILIGFLLKLLALNFFFTWSGSDFLTTLTVWAIIAYGIIEISRFNKKISPVEISINNHVESLCKFNNNAVDEFENIKDMFIANDLLKDKWVEYEHTLIKRDNPPIVYKTESAEIFFNESNILANKINLRYWYAVPGIFVGLGIFGTFIGLTYGLSNFSTGSTDKIQSSIQLLLSGMTTAFVTSVWGMAISIFFNFYEKIRLHSVGSTISNLNRQIDKIFTLTTQEKIAIEQKEQLEMQTTALQAFSTDLADRIKIAMDSVLATRLESLQGVVEKLYQEGALSTDGIIKEIKASGENITTGLRESVGNIMIEKLSPSLEEVAKSINSLVPVVEGLREEKQETSIEVIKSLVEEFKTFLSGSTKNEMERLSLIMENAGKSLTQLPTHLEGMVAVINEQSQQMRHFFGTLTTEQGKVSREISEKLMIDATTATAMMREEVEKSTNNFGEVIKDIHNNMNQLLSRQESNAQITEALIRNSETVLQRGSELTQNMDKTMRSISESIGQIQNTTKELSIASETFRDSSETLQVITTEFSNQSERHLSANTEVIKNITSTLEVSKKLVAEYADRFKIIENGLSGIFDSLKGGLDQYTRAVRQNLNDSLSEFSNNLSDAAQHLTGSVDCLKETMEDLEEILSSIKKLISEKNK